MNIVATFTERARAHAGQPAIVTARGGVSFGELESRSARLASRFGTAGLSQGDVTLLMVPFGIDLYVALLALFRVGAVALFAEPATGLGGIAAALDAVDAKAACGDWRAMLLKRTLPRLRRIPLALPTGAPDGDAAEIREVGPDHPALITFTSGSTGAAKGIVRTHGFLAGQQQALRSALRPREGGVDLISLPMFVLSNLGEGVTSVLPDGDIRRPGKIDPAPLLSQIGRHGVTRLLAPPALCRSLAEHGRTAPGLGRIVTGGGPVFPNLLDSLARLAPGAEITAVYGSTEAEPIAHVSRDEIGGDDLARMRAGEGLLAGAIHEDIRLRTVDDEILVSGPHVVKGYLNPLHDSATKVRDGDTVWHRTGDAGRVDGDGRLWLLGRKEAGEGSGYPFSYEVAAQSNKGVRHAAYLMHRGKSVLVVEAAPGGAGDALETLAGKFPGTRVVEGKVPLDRRHNSKVDYARLRGMLEGGRL